MIRELNGVARPNGRIGWNFGYWRIHISPMFNKSNFHHTESYTIYYIWKYLLKFHSHRFDSIFLANKQCIILSANRRVQSWQYYVVYSKLFPFFRRRQTREKKLFWTISRIHTVEVIEKNSFRNKWAFLLAAELLHVDCWSPSGTSGGRQYSCLAHWSELSIQKGT